MKRKTLFLLITALLSCTGVRAQSTPPSAQQPAKPYTSLDDDPQFKRLPPDQQELVRKMMEGVDKAIAAGQTNTGASPKAAPNPASPAPNAQPAPAGCIASPVKKPKFHIPKSVQDAVNKTTKQIAGKTGVALDPNAAAQTVNSAQKDIPCPPAPATKPANK